MDQQPMSVTVQRTLKDLDQFIKSGSSRNQASTLSPVLNYSSDGDTTNTFFDGALGLSSSRKRQLDSLTGLNVSKRFREKNTELVSSKAMISSLESRLQTVEMKSKKDKLEYDTELETLRHRQMRDKELTSAYVHFLLNCKHYTFSLINFGHDEISLASGEHIDNLQHRIKMLQTKERESKNDSFKQCKDAEDGRREAETKMIRIQREHLKQKDEFYEKLNVLQMKLLAMDKELEEKSLQVELADSNVKDMQQKLSEQDKKIVELTSCQMEGEAVKVELDKTKAHVKELENQMECFEYQKKITGDIETLITKMPSLEKEVTRLRDENHLFRETMQNVQLLEEKLAGAQQKSSLLDKRCVDLVASQAVLQLVKNTYQQFENIVKEELHLVHMPVPEELRNLLIKLRQGDDSLSKSIGELQASLKSVEKSRELAGQELNEVRQQLDRQKQMNQRSVTHIKKLQRKLSLVSKERDGLKAILTSHEAEVTVNYSAIGQQKISLLENQLEEYKQENAHLEKELEETHEALKEASDGTPPAQPSKEMQEKCAALEEEKKALQAEMTKLTSEKEGLELCIEYRALKGDYDPTKTKVLHFADNPLSKAIDNRRSENERLLEENNALRERVRLLEEGDKLNLTQRVGVKVEGDAMTSKEVQDLQKKANSMELQNKRLMEVFKKKSQEMREVVFRLTGYRYDLTQENQYKLINIYAESPEDFLLFESNLESPDPECPDPRMTGLNEQRADFSSKVPYLSGRWQRRPYTCTQNRPR
ncbi:mitotic spindle assembly checkpoint protein MAD1-like isoform X7 [Oratosquilla oratoria]|uniref:mitotic spindle assembly checkpoint protein MAD1-like isoform X7 n=1 Tax=Oratosquilla oratoria TaxID=337810 RepID=UPI003F75EF76